jgi:hypothetical protein
MKPNRINIPQPPIWLIIVLFLVVLVAAGASGMSLQ